MRNIMNHIEMNHIDMNHIDVNHIDVNHIDMNHIEISDRLKTCYACIVHGLVGVHDVYGVGNIDGGITNKIISVTSYCNHVMAAFMLITL